MHGGDKAQCTGLLLFVSIRVLGTLTSVQPWPANPLSLRREAEERLVQRLLPQVLAATPFPKPWCLNILLWRGGGSFLQMTTVQCLLCGYGGLGAQALQVSPTINLAHTGKHGNGRKRQPREAARTVLGGETRWEAAS